MAKIYIPRNQFIDGPGSLIWCCPHCRTRIQTRKTGNALGFWAHAKAQAWHHLNEHKLVAAMVSLSLLH